VFRRRLGWGFLALGAGMLAFWAWAALDGLAFRATFGRRLDHLLGHDRPRPLIAEALVSRRQAGKSGLIGRIEIPRLGLSELVIEGTGGRSLRRGVGHVPRTAFPGERGNVALAGHRDSYFARLRDVAKGDLIRLETPDGVFAYRVATILIVDPGRADLLAQTGSPRLTLVTCYPFHWVGPAPRRYVVVARPDRAAGRTGVRV
jgi:LPXTG-site transpeptidase (sortase) family protein